MVHGSWFMVQYLVKSFHVMFINGLNIVLSFSISLHVDGGIILHFQALVIHTFAHGHTLKN
jgi:hypothetical protein